VVIFFVFFDNKLNVFGLTVIQNKTFEDVTLVFKKPMIDILTFNKPKD